MNLYEEIVHIPLFAHDPRRPRGGERVSALTQAIDIAPTVLDLFGVPAPREMEGHNLLPVAGSVPRREAAIFGYFGGAVNVTEAPLTGRPSLFATMTATGCASASPTIPDC